MTGLILFAAFGVVALITLTLNRDIFSPAKLYTGFVCLTFLDIFLHPYSLVIIFIFLGLLLLAVITAVMERQASGGSDFSRVTLGFRGRTLISRSELRCVAFVFWCISLIPLGVQLYLVMSFGGLDQYLNAMAVRHSAFRGLGSIMEIGRSISIINLVYFALGLLGKARRAWWLAYSLHFAATLSVLFFSGSRTYLVSALLMLVMVFHHVKKHLSLPSLSAYSAILVCLATIVGIVRMNQRALSDGLVESLTPMERESSILYFRYGLLPLEVVLESDINDPKYGSTFFAALTSVIPRPLWPEKPDIASRTMTIEYFGDMWHGTSNINPGLIAESIMNFGHVGGVVAGLLLVLGALLVATRLYRKLLYNLLRSGITIPWVFQLLNFMCVSIGIATLPFCESAEAFTATFVELAMLCAIRVGCLRFLRFSRRNAQMWSYPASFYPALGGRTAVR